MPAPSGRTRPARQRLGQRVPAAGAAAAAGVSLATALPEAAAFTLAIWTHGLSAGAGVAQTSSERTMSGSRGLVRLPLALQRTSAFCLGSAMTGLRPKGPMGASLCHSHLLPMQPATQAAAHASQTIVAVHCAQPVAWKARSAPPLRSFELLQQPALRASPPLQPRSHAEQHDPSQR